MPKILRKLLPGMALLVCCAAPVRSQSADQVRLSIEGVPIWKDGGEQPSVGFAGRGTAVGLPISGFIAKSPGLCGMYAASRDNGSDHVIAWVVTATPTRIVDDAITFRVEWTRSKDAGKPSSGPGGDTELTLRPGETFPLDIADVPVPPGAPRSCNFSKVELRLRADYNPSAQDDRRVVATDLWLVQRLANGAQQSEQVSVRGQFNRATPFYFTTITDKDVSLDSYGELTVRPRDGYNEVSITTRSRLIEGGQATQTMQVSVPGLEGRRMFGARKVDSKLQLKPGEIVSVELPRLTENASGAFADRTLSITIRSRQLR